jgi:hypothetical protein
MTDIVQWLRNKSSEHNMYRCDEAADRIEQLEAALRAVVTNWEVPTYGHDADKLDNVFDAIELARAALENKND